MTLGMLAKPRFEAVATSLEAGRPGRLKASVRLLGGVVGGPSKTGEAVVLLPRVRREVQIRPVREHSEGSLDGRKERKEAQEGELWILFK